MWAITSPAEKSGTVTGDAVLPDSWFVAAVRGGAAVDGPVVAGAELAGAVVPGVVDGFAAGPAAVVVVVVVLDRSVEAAGASGPVARSSAKSSSSRSWACAYSRPVPHSW